MEALDARETWLLSETEFRGTEIANKKGMYWSKLISLIAVGLCFGVRDAGPLRGESGLMQQPRGASLRQYPAGSAIGSRPEVGFDIREDIRKARKFLERKRSGYTVTIERTTVPVTDRHGRTREKVVTRKVMEPSFLLAVEDLRERRLRQVRYTSRGCETEGFDVVRTRKNGVASRFEVRYPGNIAVLALRTMVHAGKKGYKEVVYTPYGPEIDTRQVREDGLNYLRGQIESARSRS